MLRIGFLPSDFNPMVLMLGEAGDLRLLASVYLHANWSMSAWINSASATRRAPRSR
jgi:hypothetical protein